LTCAVVELRLFRIILK